METLIYRTPFRLRNKWLELYQKGLYTPFQAWRLNLVWFLVFGLKGTRRKFKPLFYYFHDEENTGNECIIPVLVNKKQKILANYSQFGPIDYYDIICGKSDKDFLGGCLELLFEHFSGYSMHFENVNEHSVLFGLLDGFERITAPCVRIEFGSSSYEDYFGGLSKHQRQNIRTAYNRLQKTGLSYATVKYDAANTIPRDVENKCAKIYEGRCAMKNGKKTGVLGKIVAVKERLTNLVNLLVREKGNAVFVFFVENEPTAYLVCFYDAHRPVVYVPRLSANIDYLKYDPGILLLNEAIKILLAEGISVVDLTRGDEPYKFSMGGTVVNNYTFRKKL